MADVGSGGELSGQELLIGVPVLGNHFQKEIGLARQHVAFADLGPLPDSFLKSLQIRLGLRIEADLGEHGDVEAQGLGLQIGVIAANVPGLFQRPHAPKTRRRGNAGATGQFHVGDAAVSL